jgi:hypothetical protein
LSPQDLQPFDAADGAFDADGVFPQEGPLLDSAGQVYLIREVAGEGSLLELRWTRYAATTLSAFASVTLRDVVGALEAYEPARGITLHTLRLEQRSTCLSTRRLREESERLARSPIVLNRRLREAVERHVARGLSMSEIATRCGRTKHDRRGNSSGETSWLARRIGQLPEGGDAEPTPWVHSDTLALIAGSLGLNPNEVEL